MTWTKGVMAIMHALAAVCLLADGGGAADLPVGRPVPIKELRERTSSLVGRDVAVAGVVEVVAPITEANFDDWRLVSPCAGSYYVTLKDETGILAGCGKTRVEGDRCAPNPLTRAVDAHP